MGGALPDPFRWYAFCIIVTWYPNDIGITLLKFITYYERGDTAMAISVCKLEVWKETVTSLRDLFPSGAVFAITDLEKLTWKTASKVFDVADIRVGLQIRSGGAPDQAIKGQCEAIERIPRSVYGMRLIMYANPIFENNTVVGSIIVILPRLHPIATAFPVFAPMIASLFPEGAFLFVTDMEMIGLRQASSKFDMPDMQLGNKTEENPVIHKAIKTKQMVVEEMDSSVHDFPVMIMCYPCYEEDDPNQMVGVLGLALPRKTAFDLREMSNSLCRGLEEISATMQQLAASSVQITDNERQLNQKIGEIDLISEDINTVLEFIKQIAEETKMLGLNAAIEAARAGEFGRGFGVVADEIRQLSDESKGTVGKIRALTDSIKEKIKETTRNSESTMLATEEQAAASEEVIASIVEITGMAEHLDTIAKEI